MEMHDIDEEDEDVVIQGSALYEHLSKLGYTDFETLPVLKRTDFKQENYLNIDIRNIVKKIYSKLFSLYSWITQEKSNSKKQLSIILNAEALLNDHFTVINGFINKCNNNSKNRITSQELIVAGAVLISSICISLCKHKILPTLFALFAICSIGYMKYLRFYANRNLEIVILLQNELFLMCKDGLKILQRDYKMKLDFELCLQQFSHFLGEKLQYLESIKDTLIKFMENISCIYYKCSLSIEKLLPPDALSEELFTKFEHDSFEVSGEINYQTLKRLYNTYLLVQSEMLYLLAIAYNSDTWTRSCQKIPETELAHIIFILTKELTVHKTKLSGIIEAYRTCKTEPIRYYKAQNKAKWHDPTVQLDLASYKLQLAYNQVFSIFKDIDDCINKNIDINNETADALMQKLDKAFKEIDTAKSLAEFVILMFARSRRIDDLRSNQLITNDTMVNQNSDLPVIDSDPQILDEVFEEYIKEEYLKPDEDTDEYSLEQQKLDQLLAKNFMNELKEALVDKHKSMSERESRALQRIYKNMSKNPVSSTEDNKNYHTAPVPPPMPPYYIWSTPSSDGNLDHRRVISPIYKIRNDDSSIHEKSDESHEENKLVRVQERKNIFNESAIEVCENRDEKSIGSMPQILLETQAMRFITKLPSSFLHEETFIGSGENSEDEIINNASDNEENNVCENSK